MLRTRLPRLRAAEWIGVTATLALAGWIVGMTPSLFMSDEPTAAQGEPSLMIVLLMAAIAGGGAGVCFGAAQWFILRRHAERAVRWIWIHVPAQRKGHVDLTDLEFAQRPYHWLAANKQAQKARWLFVSELAHRAPTLMTAAVHPGAVLTGAQARLPRLLRALMYSLARPAFVRPEVGAIPVLRLAAHPHLGNVTGRFFDRCHLTSDVAETALAQDFSAACEGMTGQHWSRQKGERVPA